MPSFLRHITLAVNRQHVVPSQRYYDMYIQAKKSSYEPSPNHEQAEQRVMLVIRRYYMKIPSAHYQP